MSKFDADKKTGLPPNKTTRFQLPDARINEPQLSQAARQKAIYQKVDSGPAFSRVGIVGQR